MHRGITGVGNSERFASFRKDMLAWVSFLALIAAPSLMTAAPLQQDPGADGLVSIDVGDFDANVSQGGHSWTPVFPTGYTGSGALEATPNSGVNNDIGYVTASPRLDYVVNFVRTGVHYVWIRGAGLTGNDDSLHVGLDGASVASAERISNFGSGLSWSNTQMGGAVVTINVPTLGEHTLNVWMREDGMIVDQVALTTNGGYTPVGAGTTLLVDNFDDGDALGWGVVTNCASANWLVLDNVYKQVSACRLVLPEGAEIGSYALSLVPPAGNVDIQLRVRSEDPALDAVTSNDWSNWKFGAIGVLFGYQNDSNYYLFEMNAMKGYRKLWRRQGGVFTELNTSPQSYVGEQWMDLRIIHQNGVILVFIDGQQVMAAQDATFAGGRLALFCSGNSSCSFDDIVVRGAPAAPMSGLNLPDGSAPAHAAGEYFVDTDGDLEVSGFSTLGSGIGGMEFVVDEGSVGEVSQTDLTAPYSAQFNGLLTGDHTVTGYLLDSGLVRLTAPEATVTLPHVGTNGIHLYCVGDSITLGFLDDLAFDDVSLDGRNTGGGYAPVLNDYLSASNSGVPVTVWNDGNSGETTAEGVSRIGGILARTPQVQAYLFGYGTNDSGGSLPLPSGLRLNPGDPGYAGSYKYYLQQVIDAVVAPPPVGAGKRLYFAKVPPFLSSATRDARVQEFNQVIDELLAELKLTNPSDYLSYLAPDFYAYFTANPGELISDGIHPSGMGYRSMARLWCGALNGQQGWNCITGP